MLPREPQAWPESTLAHLMCRRPILIVWCRESRAGIQASPRLYTLLPCHSNLSPPHGTSLTNFGRRRHDRTGPVRPENTCNLLQVIMLRLISPPGRSAKPPDRTASMFGTSRTFGRCPRITRFQGSGDAPCRCPRRRPRCGLPRALPWLAGPKSPSVVSGKRDEGSLVMTRSSNQGHLTSRLICLAIAALGLLLITTVLKDADPQSIQTASTPAFAGPTLSRTIAGLTLQAEGLHATGAAMPAFAMLGTAVQLLRRS
jgi:hypothetical protein